MPLIWKILETKYIFQRTDFTNIILFSKFRNFQRCQGASSRNTSIAFECISEHNNESLVPSLTIIYKPFTELSGLPSDEL
jgi:hypothetical protein